MKVLLLNSSSKRLRSRSLKIAKAFISGLEENEGLGEEKEIVEVNLFDMKINDCIGCYSCWRNPSGNCVQDDDMSKLINEYISADIVIWSFPLLCYSIPAKMKVFIERLLPIYNAEIESRRDDGYVHVRRYSDLKREVFISTCGFPSQINNYESVKEMIRIMCGDNACYIFCTQSSIFEFDKFSKVVQRYLNIVKEAGKKFSMNKGIDDGSKSRLNRNLLPEDIYMAKVNEKEWLGTKIN